MNNSYHFILKSNVLYLLRQFYYYLHFFIRECVKRLFSNQTALFASD